MKLPIYQMLCIKSSNRNVIAKKNNNANRNAIPEWVG